MGSRRGGVKVSMQLERERQYLDDRSCAWLRVIEIKKGQIIRFQHLDELKLGIDLELFSGGL